MGYRAAGSQRIWLSREHEVQSLAAEAWSREACEEWHNWADHEPRHILLHRTIYYSLGDDSLGG